jgi:hypothetical protein
MSVRTIICCSSLHQRAKPGVSRRARVGLLLGDRVEAPLCGGGKGLRTVDIAKRYLSSPFESSSSAGILKAHRGVAKC